MKPRIFYIDLMRFIAELLVIDQHLDRYIRKFTASFPPVLRADYVNDDLGSMGVTLFILISGASLMTSYAARFDLGRFASKRFLTILPLYWVTYAVVAAYLVGNNGHLSQAAPWTYLLTVLGMDGFFLYRIPDHYLIGEWFIGFILLLYGCFPFLRLLILRRPWISWFCILLFVIGLEHYYTDFFILEAERNPLIRLLDLATGMLFARLGSPLRAKYFAAAVLFLCVFFTVPVPLPHVLNSFLTGAALFYVLAYMGEFFLTNGRIRRMIESIAHYSFPAFLVHHMFIFWLLPAHSAIFSSSGLLLIYLVIVVLSYGTGYFLTLATNGLIHCCLQLKTAWRARFPLPDNVIP